VSSAAFERLIESVRAALQARRTALATRTGQIERALAAYTAAVEDELATAYAAEHGLKKPRSDGPSARQAAAALLDIVSRLPELQGADSRSEPAQVAAPPSPAETPTPREEPARPSGSWPELVSACRNAPLVIVGGVSKAERLTDLPEGVRATVEWIDTTRQGTHAIGNLERRIRDRRLAALVVLEGVISHRHSDPLISAARQVGLPCAYGGKGGKGTLSRAFNELETSLRGRRD
jgi:hypothetical protein